MNVSHFSWTLLQYNYRHKKNVDRNFYYVQNIPQNITILILKKIFRKNLLQIEMWNELKFQTCCLTISNIV